MSIAISVIVGPARSGRLLLAGCSLALAGAACAVGLATPARFPCAPWLALALAATAGVLMRTALGRAKTHRIDISGTGELRVTVQQDVGAAGTTGATGTAALPAAAPASLLAGTVLWPALVMLRYAAPDASAHGSPAHAVPVPVPVHVLPVWRDSVDPAAWRALTVALAMIGRRDGEERIDKIR
jgi:hypothetical protein